jgi:hypothetical protein
MADRRRVKGEGTIRLRSDGRYESREPPEIVPPGEKRRAASTARASERWRRRSAGLVASGSRV